jgi:predicted nucleotidyltransferase
MELCEDLLDARVDFERVTVDAPLESAKRGLRRMESCKRHIGRFSPEDRPHLEDFPPFSRAAMFAMYTAEQVIETLRAHDIDLAAEFDPAARMDLLQLSALERRIAELVGRPVDLLPEPVEKRRLQNQINQDRRRAF